MSRRPRGAVALVLAAVLAGACLLACHRAEPPSLLGLDGSVAPLPGPGANAGAGAGAYAGAGAGANANANANADAAAHTSGATAGAGSEPPPAVTGGDAGPDPGTLAQTKDKPEASGVAFDARAAALWDAIVKDDPERAMPFFFPLAAYEQVKAIQNASADWRRRLVAAYKRDVHALHKRLGDRASDAKLVRLDVPQDRARWVEPGDEYNKIGYHRVYGTRLLYEIEGKERSFEVTSLISWRGEWYVVHLTGFK